MIFMKNIIYITISMNEFDNAQLQCINSQLN